MNELLFKSLYKTDCSLVYNELVKYTYAHKIIADISNIIKEAILSLDCDFIEVENGIFIHRDAHISKNATILAPCIIDKNADIRHSAYLRGNVIVGKDCVVGNSCELKSAILFDGACVPHFNYVGNSLLGYKSHLGAGAIISNLKSDKSNVKIDINGQKTDTGSRKFGALVGDFCEVGCGSVLNPGTVLMPHSTIYPLSCVRGTVPENSIYKGKGNIVKRW
ncbi:MAG: UDP-N-acetylglucosamine pyrophosphorylase [Clostridia bacterium]|nr:UDP-N-acetylglucosamine pyrophosphorylase [Clostridia bacterium]MBO5338910.1 UDP-N-acetylglucosamine pyrophosphorylase [Clostridia bacterium]